VKASKGGALGIGIGSCLHAENNTVKRFLASSVWRVKNMPRGLMRTFVTAGPIATGFCRCLAGGLNPGTALVTGASRHIVHITSMAFRQTPLALEMIDAARKKGVDVTTERYPDTAGMMRRLESAVFDEGWQQRLGIDVR
jgi:dihydroorotase